MEALVDKQGRIHWRIYDEPVGQVDDLDYGLHTPTGLTLPGMAKRLLAHQFHFLGIIGDETIGGLAVVDLKFLAQPGKIYFFREGVIIGLWRARTSGVEPLTHQQAMESIRECT